MDECIPHHTGWLLTPRPLAAQKNSFDFGMSVGPVPHYILLSAP